MYVKACFPGVVGDNRPRPYCMSVSPRRQIGSIVRFVIVELLFDPDSGETEEQAGARIMPRYAANVERYLRDSPSLVSRI